MLGVVVIGKGKAVERPEPPVVGVAPIVGLAQFENGVLQFALFG